MTWCLLMMGGSGTRLGADRPKQFIEIDGRPLFSFILEMLNDSDNVDSIVIVVHKDWIEYVQDWVKRILAKKVFAVIAGGGTRSESVKNGLCKINEMASDKDVVLIHDATHPYVDDSSMKDLVESVKTFGAATMVQRQFDTCYSVDENDMIVNVVPRQFIVSGASPEGFVFRDIFDIYSSASDEELRSMTSAGAIALEHGIKMKVCTLNTINLKITYKNDLDFLMATKNYFFDRHN